MANELRSGGFFVGSAYSVRLLLTQHGAQALNVTRDDSQRDVSLEAHNPMVRTDVQAM